MWWSPEVGSRYPPGDHLTPNLMQIEDHISPQGGDTLPLIEDPLNNSLQKVGTARYCTMRTVYHGRDEDRKRARSLERVSQPRADNKEMLTPRLPQLVFNEYSTQKTHDLPQDPPKYLDNYKLTLQMRGLVPQETKKKRRRKRHKLPDIRISNGPTSDVASTARLSEMTSVRSDNPHDVVSDYGSSYISFSTQGTGTSPRLKDHNIGKPTQFVSSRRLNQLLEAENQLKKENFYNQLS